LPSLETTRQEIDYIATARARIGYTITPDALLYGTAGLAWERVDQMRITSLIDGTTTNAAAFDRFGWVAGGGLDAALGDGGWIGRIEYLHHNFGTVETTRHTTTDPPIATPPFTNTADDQTVDEVRAALVYKIH
jgi:outer membrane immunogenic protein